MALSWKITIAVVLVALLVGVVVAILAEWKTARKMGGFKAWVTDVPTVNYRTVRATYLSEVVVAYLTVAIVAHSVWPTVFADLQIEAIWAVFAFLGTMQGVNVAAFIGKRATANPEMVAATAAADQAPRVMPQVTTEKTESTPNKETTKTTTVSPVTPAAAKGPLTDALAAEKRLQPQPDKPLIFADD